MGVVLTKRDDDGVRRCAGAPDTAARMKQGSEYPQVCLLLFGGVGLGHPTFPNRNFSIVVGHQCRLKEDLIERSKLFLLLAGSR
jgi:hypothetical protein